jgi:hypothetical protein
MRRLARQAAESDIGYGFGTAILLRQHIGAEHVTGETEGNDLSPPVAEDLVEPDETAFDEEDTALAVALMEKMFTRPEAAFWLMGEDRPHGARTSSLGALGVDGPPLTDFRVGKHVIPPALVWCRK